MARLYPNIYYFAIGQMIGFVYLSILLYKEQYFPVDAKFKKKKVTETNKEKENFQTPDKRKASCHPCNSTFGDFHVLT